MTPFLDETLCTKYPKIFADRHGSKMETLMCWGFEHGDGWFEILDTTCRLIQSHIDTTNEHRQYCIRRNGLYVAHHSNNSEMFDKFFKELYSDKGFSEEYINKQIEWVIEQGPIEIPKEVPQVVAVQVKEKFGRLNFYYNGGDEYIRGVIRMAEAMSAITCMTCGKPGQLVTKGWWHVACDEHRKKDDAVSTDDSNDNI